MTDSQKNSQTIDTYISRYPIAVQEILIKLRRIVKKILPDATESITYGIPTFKHNGKYVVFFGAYPQHISLYPIPPCPNSFNKKIEPYRAGKGTIKFPLHKPIPYDLVEEIVKLSLEDNIARTTKKNESF